MSYKNILVPYDKSESAKHALATAIDIAAPYADARITVLFAPDMPDFDDASFSAAAEMAGVAQMSEEDIKKMQRGYLAHQISTVKDNIAPIIEGCKNTITCKLGEGKPAKAILEFATENENDVIVMGCRGLGAVRGMMGSVSYAVIRSAECPVLVVK